ncbi:MAG: GNAT family N-acetyltransferase [Planctomycetota bacterium]
MMTRSEPIFPVRDLAETISFYRDVLGGSGEWLYGDPPGFGGIRMGEAQLMFELNRELAQRASGIGHFFFCQTIDEQHSQHIAAGAPIIEPIENKPWGFREYVVLDPNGVRLRFAGPVGYKKPPTAMDVMPENIMLENRLPTAHEYLALMESVGWEHEPERAKLLDHSFAGVVAVDQQTKLAVGMARVVHDATRWYSIWDVAVRPEYQSKQIGASMIDRALAELRGAAPAGSFVHLFTLKPEFYERVGFKDASCSQIRL